MLESLIREVEDRADFHHGCRKDARSEDAVLGSSGHHIVGVCQRRNRYGAGMSSIVLNGLVKRHADLTGEAEAIRSRQDEISATLVHLEAVILLFDPNYDLQSVRPRRYTSGEPYYVRPHARIVLSILREVGAPTTTRDIIKRVIAVEDRDPRDPAVRRDTAKRVLNALQRQRAKGVVGSQRTEGNHLLWAII